MLEAIASLLGVLGQPRRWISTQPTVLANAVTWDAQPFEYTAVCGRTSLAVFHLGGADISFEIGFKPTENMCVGDVLVLANATPYALRATAATDLLIVAFDEAHVRQSPVPMFGRPHGFRILQSSIARGPSVLSQLGICIEGALEQFGDENSSATVALVLAVIEAISANADFVGQSQPTSLFVDRGIQRLIAFIDQHSSEKLSLQRLSEAVGMSPSHLSRSFGAAMGLSPQAYVRKKRCELACQLLAFSRDSLAEIAYAAGFSSQSAMNALFRKSLGMTPLEYRRRAWRERAPLAPSRVSGQGMTE